MKVLIIGEECTDIFCYGTVERINPEAPSVILSPSHEIVRHGMARNVKENFESIRALMSKKDEIYFVSQSEKIVKERYVEDKHNYILLRVDRNDEVERISLSTELKDELPTFDIVIVSDYNKGFLKKADLRVISALAKKSIIDTKKSLGKWAEKFTWIKINSTEFDNPDHEKAFMMENIEKIIVTLGKNGAAIVDTLYESKHKVDVMDVSGAGDTFLAAFASAVLNDMSLEKSIELANFMSSIAVSHRGVINDPVNMMTDEQHKTFKTIIE